MKNLNQIVKEILNTMGERGTDNQIKKYLKLFKSNEEIIRGVHDRRVNKN